MPGRRFLQVCNLDGGLRGDGAGRARRARAGGSVVRAGCSGGGTAPRRPAGDRFGLAREDPAVTRMLCAPVVLGGMKS
jgi:hypothetical protein